MSEATAVIGRVADIIGFSWERKTSAIFEFGQCSYFGLRSDMITEQSCF